MIQRKVSSFVLHFHTDTIQVDYKCMKR